jgi:hypothetical protein
VATNWDAVGAIGGVFSAIAALVSIYMARQTISAARLASKEQGEMTQNLVSLLVSTARENSREKTANETYDSYLRLCIDYPDLTSWAVAAESHGFKSPEEIWVSVTTKSEQYLWFLSFALNAFERILIDGGGADDADWTCAIEDQIEYHAEALNMLWKTNFRNHYSPELDAVVLRVLSRELSKAAE